KSFPTGHRTELLELPNPAIRERLAMEALIAVSTYNPVCSRHVPTMLVLSAWYFLLPQLIALPAPRAGEAQATQTAAKSPLELEHPTSIAIDSKGNVYVGALVQNSIFKLDRQGRVVPFAGNGAAGFSGDGGAGADANLYSPWGLTLDGQGNLLI